MSKKRVLIYAPMVGRGGVHLVARKLAQGFDEYASKRWWDFDVLGQQYDEIGLPIEWPATWNVIQIDPVPKLPPHPYLFESLRKNAQTFYDHLLRVVDGYDVVFSFSPWWTMNVPEFDLPVPYVVNIADFAFDHFMEVNDNAVNNREVAMRAAEKAAAVIFSSDFQCNHGEQHYGMKNTRVVRYSSDFVAEDYSPTPEEVARVRVKYNLPEHYVLAFHCFGHKDPFTIYNGQYYARSRSAKVPPIVLAGIETELYAMDTPPDNHAREFQALIRKLGGTVGKDTFILGTVPDSDIAGLHAGAAVAVSASRSEGGLSGSAFNAFMAHTPLVFSDLPVFTEVLGTEKQYGIHFPVGDHVALGQAIIEACENPAVSRQRADAAYDLLATRTLKDVVNDYLDVFKSVIE